MSEKTNLSELAQFIGQSRMATIDAVSRRATAGPSTGGSAQRPARRSVTELLGVVLTLSARTRRMALPKVAIDLDVFGPSGRRAVRIKQRPAT